MQPASKNQNNETFLYFPHLKAVREPQKHFTCESGHEFMPTTRADASNPKHQKCKYLHTNHGSCIFSILHSARKLVCNRVTWRNYLSMCMCVWGGWGGCNLIAVGRKSEAQLQSWTETNPGKSQRKVKGWRERVGERGSRRTGAMLQLLFSVAYIFLNTKSDPAATLCHVCRAESWHGPQPRRVRGEGLHCRVLEKRT